MSSSSGGKTTSETWSVDGNIITCVIDHAFSECHSQEFFYLRDTQIQYSFTKYDGKDLTGVYTDAALTQAYTGTGAVGAVLYPGYTVKTYTVELNTGLTDGTSSLTVEHGQIPEFPTLERPGYIFDGWLDTDGRTYAGTPITSDAVFTAKWIPETVNVKVYVAGALYGQVDVANGTKVSEIFEELNLKYNVVESTKNQNDEVLTTLRYNDPVTQDVKLYVREQNAGDKVETFVGSYWYIFVAIGALTIVGIVFGLTQTKKHKRGYRR